MGGQMERGKRLQQSFKNGAGVVSDIIDDPEKMTAVKDGLTDLTAKTLDKGTELLTDMVDTTSKTLEGLTKDDLTVEKINELAQKGPDAVVEAIKSAGFLASFAGGPAGIAGMLTRGGGAAIYQHLNKPPEAAPVAEEKKFDWLQAIIKKDFVGIGGEIKGTFDGITSGLDTATDLANSFEGEGGGPFSKIINQIKGFVSSFMPTITGMISKFIPGFSLTENTPADDQPSAEEQAELAKQQQQKALEAQRQQELARQQQKDLGPSPQTTQDEFERAHDDKPLTQEEKIADQRLNLTIDLMNHI